MLQGFYRAPACCRDADKYEIQEAHAAHENALLAQDMAAGKSSAMMVQVDERNNAVCVINAHGIIQMANKAGAR